jgi:hypothetical protein
MKITNENLPNNPCIGNREWGAWIWRYFLLTIVIGKPMVHRMYIRYERGRSGVAERRYLGFQSVLQKSKEYCSGNIFSLLLENKWCIECISDMDASSREWRSGATLTTGCEAQWTLDFRMFYRNWKEYCLWNNFCLFLENQWFTECISDMDASSREWRSVVDARSQSSSIENIKNTAMKVVMMMLHIRICVQLDSLMSKRSFRKGCANR